MKSAPMFALVGLVISLTACKDDLPAKSSMEPPPPAQGVQAFVQVDNETAQPGQRVQVYVRTQLGTETSAKIGSYTGRLRFDPQLLGWVQDDQISDGLRVTNPNGAAAGDIRFAGASAAGFNDLALYHGE